VAVPTEMPETVPLVAPAVATEVLLLLQVPPVVASLKTVDAPTHIIVVPVIGNGLGPTVTVVVTMHPVPKE
jgi:hypothetical protein